MTSNTPDRYDEQPLLTAEEFGRMPDVGPPEELVRGKIVSYPYRIPRDGEVCATLGWLLEGYRQEHDAGYVLIGRTGVVVERNPDTVRGADVVYYSYTRLPRGSLSSSNYGPEIPELVFEVKSPSDRWPALLQKVAEYLIAGALFVTVLDPEEKIAVVFSAEDPPRTLGPDDELTIPDVLPGFRVDVNQVFE
jgi:Uma2 family endonuclease